MNNTKKQTPALNLNPDEEVLIEKLMEVYALENSMDDIRRKYGEAWGTLLKRVYPTLDWPIVRLNEKQGRVGCARRTWLSFYPDDWPSGFYIESINLENLCAADDERPYASIWIAPPDKLHIDLETYKKSIRQKADDCIGEPLEEKESESRIELWYYLPETRLELISALGTDRGREFFVIMEKYLERFRPLIPLIDTLFAKSLKPSTTA